MMTETRGRARAAIVSGLAVGALLVGLATAADAGDDRSPARDRKTKSVEAAPESAPEVKTERSSRPIRLYGTSWVRDTAAAVAAGKKAKKPIFLVRMLGELDEKT